MDNLNQLIKKSFLGWEINQLDLKKPICGYCNKPAIYEIKFCHGLLGTRLICEDHKRLFLRQHDKIKKVFD